MLNKTKKMLACATLGLVGMGCLAGCSMSDEQQKALDLITDKADEIVNLLEENMEYNNTNLSKEDAAEKILLARSRWKLLQFNELEYSLIQNSYYGLFDKINQTLTDNEATPLRWLYRQNGDNKVFAIAEGDNFDTIITSNFKDNIHLRWDYNEDSTLISREYSTDDFVLSLDLFSGLGIDIILAEDVKDIEITESGYIFKVIKEISNDDETIIEEVVFNVSFDCYITSFVAKAVFEKENGEYESWFVECEYKYDNVDFTALDAKIAELTSAE